MSGTLDELIEKIKQRYDPDDLVEALEITTDELIECFYIRVEEKRDRFDEYEEEDELYLNDPDNHEGC